MKVAPLLLVLSLVVAPQSQGAEIAADQRQVAIGYERLETLALRIADAVEPTDSLRAEQIRTAIGDARAAGLSGRFERVVGLLERERYTSARKDQTELAGQLEELLRLVMADPSESRLEEERRRLERLRKEIRSALREQRSLRARSSRGERAANAARQRELADRIERLQEPAEETDRLAGQEGATTDSPDSDAQGEEGKGGEPSKKSSQSKPRSIADRLRAGERSMRDAGDKLAEESEEAERDQRDAQRELEAAQREAEERLRQLREEEKQRRLATLAERFRRMHEAEAGLIGDLTSRVEAVAGAATLDRATRIAMTRLADRQAEVGTAVEQALRVVRADGASLVFDDALVQLNLDAQVVEDRLRDNRLDPTSVALAESILKALAELIAAVDESLDELEQQRGKQGEPGQGGGGGASPLVSKLAELRMIRSLQARLLKQTEVWGRAVEAGDADAEEVTERLGRLADEQRRLAAAARKTAKAGP